MRQKSDIDRRQPLPDVQIQQLFQQVGNSVGTTDLLGFLDMFWSFVNVLERTALGAAPGA
jgi:hypothetical protein